MRRGEVIDVYTTLFRHFVFLHASSGVFGGARRQNFYLSVHLHPYFMHASSEGSGDLKKKRIFLINAHSDVFGEARGLKFDPNHHLHPYFVYASSKSCDVFAHMRRFVQAVADTQHIKSFKRSKYIIIYIWLFKVTAHTWAIFFPKNRIFFIF